MKATVLAESSNLLSFFIVICALQQCLQIVARKVSLYFLPFNIFFIILPFQVSIYISIEINMLCCLNNKDRFKEFFMRN